METSLIIIVLITVSILGFWLKSLTISGAVAAFIIGLLITIGFSIKGLFILGVFFGTSSLWSKYKIHQKESMENIVAKGNKRDYVQVLANGGIPALLSIMYWLNPADYILVGFCISIAAANADTWASEIGSLSRSQPLHILTLKQVDTGTSGAVSSLGTFAALSGALLIAAASSFLVEQFTIKFILIVTIFGFCGAFIDTIIGATIQAQYKCRVCNLNTEKHIHCNKQTRLVRGLEWMNNDMTNLSSIIVATCLGIIFFIL